MIAYKFVIKRNNKYYPLLNFGIDGKFKIRNCPPYELGTVYDCPKDFNTLKLELGGGIGYHFFKTSNPNGYNKSNDHYGNIKIKFTKFLKTINKIPIELTCIKCYVNNIIAENENRIVANKFKILQEVN